MGEHIRLEEAKGAAGALQLPRQVLHLETPACMKPLETVKGVCTCDVAHELLLADDHRNGQAARPLALKVHRHSL